MNAADKLNRNRELSRQASRRYRETHREEISTRKARAYRRDPSKAKARARLWQARNPARVRKSQNAWRQRNPLRVRRHALNQYQVHRNKVLAKSAAGYAAAPQKVIARELARRLANPELFRKQRRQQHRRQRDRGQTFLAIDDPQTLPPVANAVGLPSSRASENAPSLPLRLRSVKSLPAQ
jgi:hypothetical protein